MEVKPIRWGVVIDDVPIGEIWLEGNQYYAAAYIGKDRFPVDISRYPNAQPSAIAGLIRDWLATVRVLDPQLTRPITTNDLRKMSSMTDPS